ncbi:ABC transporter permease [Thiohalorhabdus sp. Cl-TMA]|uniref:ABC transporter permease n=1 Tax=Thiohalorhabdus methylotrophus TaxID=3242694 RepID=A0ABV4TYK0_9GAMM
MRRAPIIIGLSALVAAAALTPVAVLLGMGVGADVALGGRLVEVAVNSFLLTGLTVIGAVLLGVPLAFLTAYTDLPGRGVWTGLLAAPLAIPSYLGAFAFFAAFGRGGELSELTGLPWPNMDGLAGATLVMTLYTFPFVLLATRAALRNLDASTLEAARTLGMPLREALLRVVLPRVKNSVAAGALLVALYTLSDFGTPAIMRVDTFTRVIYVEYNAFGLDRAALLSIALLALVAVVLFLESRVGAVREAPGRPPLLRLGRGGKAASLTGVVVVLAAAIGMPVGVFGLWLAREGMGDFEPGILFNSASASLLAALAAVAAALPVAYAATTGRLGRMLERAAYLGFGVPGIVLGTALVVVGLYVDFLYQSLALLVFAYVVRFLPLAVGNIRAPLERSENRLVGAARLLGASPGEAFRRVTLPLILPGLLAAGALVFLEAMRELPATLLLRPTGFETLATHLWQVYEAGYFGRGAVPALLLVLVSGAAVVVMLRGEKRQPGLL